LPEPINPHTPIIIASPNDMLLYNSFIARSNNF